MRRRTPVLWAAIDTDGSILAGPSNSKSEVIKEISRRWSTWGLKPSKFVPHNPRAAGVLRLAERLVSNGEPGMYPELERAVGRYRKGKR